MYSFEIMSSVRVVDVDRIRFSCLIHYVPKGHWAGASKRSQYN